MNDIPDTRQSLLIRIQDPRNEQAWHEFLEIYEPLVYRLARRHGFQDADARDVTQEVFTTIAQAIERWDPDPSHGSFRGWLYRIARNLLLNFLASKQNRLRGSGRTEFARWLEQQPAEADAPTEFDLEYRREVFQWAAKKVQPEVSPTTWQAFWKTAVEQRPIEQTARTLNKSVGAVYAARSRVMARVKREIDRLQE